MFIPIGDDNSRRLTTPICVWFIFAVNAAVWYLQLSLGESFTYGYSTIPYEIFNNVDLTKTQYVRVMGESIPLNHSPGPTPIQLTLLSSMFMHGSWGHIIGNMLYLLIFADQIEDLLGHFRFVIFYLICGIAASLTHAYFDPQSVIPSLGASGAIAGVLGAYFVTHPTNSVRTLVWNQVVHVPAFVVLGGWILLQFVSQVSVVSGAESGVAYMAHIGGFLVGVPLILLFKRRRARRHF